MSPDDRLKREAGEKLAAQVRSNQAASAAEAQRKAFIARTNQDSYSPALGVSSALHAQMVARAKALQKSGKIETVEQARNSDAVSNALATARAQLGIEDPTMQGTEYIPIFDPSVLEELQSGLEELQQAIPLEKPVETFVAVDKLESAPVAPKPSLPAQPPVVRSKNR